MQESLLANVSTRQNAGFTEMVTLEPRAPVTNDRYAVSELRDTTHTEDVTV